MVYLTRRVEFAASHYYHSPALSAEENARLFGKCNNPNGHGHNYVLEVTVAGEADPTTGMVLDLKELKALLDREVMDTLDHRSLNHEVPAFRERIPTSENIAIEIWRMIEGKLPAGRLHRVRLYETPDLFVEYFGEQRVTQIELLPRPALVVRERRDAGSRFEVMVSEAPIAHLTRRYMFSASHRLHSPALSEAENAATYGKCNNPFGHGHNYVLEVTAAGAVHPVTGMVLNLPDMDAAVGQEILARFDHQNLNTCAEFSGARVPTSENVCQTIYMLLCARWTRDPSLGGTRLEKVRLEETHSNSFEYGPQ